MGLELLAAFAVSFAADVQTLLQKRCYGCHGPQVQQRGLRLDQRDSAMRVIQPGDPAASKLFRMVTDTGSPRMPPAGPLPPAEIAILKQWIESGATWPATPRAKPWSFSAIRRPAEPLVRNAAWKRDPIDAFLLARLESRGIQPSPQASRETLLRRVYLDLTGLLPTPDQVRAFLADTSPQAYERLTDELLRSPHFGEKWSRHWLDLARYADSEGGIQDFARPFAWRWRDWVIQAFNNDMPFDRFTREQLAGDLIPGASVAARSATGFHRNTVTSREGGIELERLRFEQLVDRTNTLSSVWLGLTAGCAQCHDHKYDPISQRDYYRLMAYFENAEEKDLEAPLPGETGIYRQYAAKFRTERDTLVSEYKIAPVLAVWEQGMRDARANPGKRPNWDIAYDIYSKLVDHADRILDKPPHARTPREQDALVDHFANRGSSGIGTKLYNEMKLKDLSGKLEKLEKQYPRLSTLMVIEPAADPKPTHIRKRGNFTDRLDAVDAGIPESLARTPAPDRLALAQWIASRQNPLTARVAVNRLWQELFGRGLVRTSEDFGMQGEKPSHPELLDWLAAEFMDRGWSLKHMIRLMVTSAAYRQSSATRNDLASTDPSNTLLARQSAFRLPAELVRDAALRASGLLNDSVGGESIRPPQPEGVADLQYNTKWEETTGRARYRRGLYVHIQRTANYPLLMNFDAPDRIVSCSRRESSNTPLQPLNLMNDPVFVEAAQALAARLEEEAKTDAARVDLAFLLCYNRQPSPAERDAVLSHVARRGADGWFGAARALLNSAEFLTRE